MDPAPRPRRLLMLALAAAGLAVAAYLTLFQLGAVDRVWDPLFTSRPVLDLTKPVPDAAAGVAAYASEIVLLLASGAVARRWVPWIASALGVVLITGAVVSLVLIAIQPLVAHAWCTLCLASAAISLVLFALGLAEARRGFAAVRALRRAPSGRRAAAPT